MRDVAGLYVYDNTLGAVKINGAQLKDYLEWSARYYKQVDEGFEFAGEDVTNAYDESRDIPDYSYDAVAGVKYDINISKPVGERIENLRLSDDTPLSNDMEFALAINNYRQSGGTSYPVADLPEIYNEQIAIRAAIIDWATQTGTIDPADFYEESWWLVSETRAVKEDPTEDPTDEHTEDPTDEGTDQPTDKGADADDRETGQGDDNDDQDQAQDTNKLPRTGTNVRLAVGLGVALLALGGALIAPSRRS